jgi:DNA modification methylase
VDYVPSELKPFVRQEIIWARAGGVNATPAFYMSTHERIVIIARPAWRLRSQSASGIGDVWRIHQEASTWHPAPFPLSLALRVLETTAAPLVVDPFIGSGTTGKAAKTLGVDFIGFDRNAAYAARALSEIALVQPLPFASEEQQAALIA